MDRVDELLQLVDELKTNDPAQAELLGHLLLDQPLGGFEAGDLINAVEDAFGESCARVCPSLTVAFQTLANHAWVARHFPPERRHPELTYSHHAAVAGLEEAVGDVMLDMAERQGWTTQDVRDVVKAWREDFARAAGKIDAQTRRDDDTRAARDEGEAGAW